MGTEFPFCRMKSILEMDGGDGYITMNVFNTTQLYNKK